MKGKDYIVGNPQLAKTGTYGPGLLSGTYFKILLTSPCRDKALSLPQVLYDYFGIFRGSSPDIGGHEYSEAGILLPFKERPGNKDGR